MNDIVRHVVWSAVFLAAASGILVLTVHINTSASALKFDPILIRDETRQDVHRLSGSMSVPKSCDELIAHVEHVTKNGYRLVFETWENPSLACQKTKTERPFEVIAFAPAEASFAATLDGKPVVIAVVQTLVKQ